MNEPLKIGFIGGGPRAGSLWQSIFLAAEDFIHPKAVFDINQETLKSWEYKVDTVHSNYDQFLKEDLDAVIIGTPPNTHAALAIKALQAGINVWSEVPMGLTMEELWGIIDADKSNKTNKGHYTLGENYCFQIEPQFMAMKNKIGALGDIYYAEGEYTHSVEHYMIVENFLENKILDPELNINTKPTWRATLDPIKYGHALGPALYVLNKNKKNIIERPTEVSAFGNMKMQKRFNTQNFQIAMIKTSEDTILKFVIGFVLGHHGRIFYSFWGSRGLFVGGSYQSENKHYYYEVPPDKAKFPERHEQQAKILTPEDLMQMGVPHALGGHGGADVVMFKSVTDSWLNNKPLDVNCFRSAEMTAPGILAVEAIKTKKVVEIPQFK
jgi:hypothetical protein